ncbi:MAG: hypothetical protein IH950_17190 [Bacteroidetes bacterium]|nr:hypothetical protein [Bacteroidota bacterium]
MADSNKGKAGPDKLRADTILRRADIFSQTVENVQWALGIWKLNNRSYAEDNFILGRIAKIINNSESQNKNILQIALMIFDHQQGSSSRIRIDRKVVDRARQVLALLDNQEYLVIISNPQDNSPRSVRNVLNKYRAANYQIPEGSLSRPLAILKNLNNYNVNQIESSLVVLIYINQSNENELFRVFGDTLIP